MLNFFSFEILIFKLFWRFPPRAGPSFGGDILIFGFYLTIAVEIIFKKIFGHRYRDFVGKNRRVSQRRPQIIFIELRPSRSWLD